MLFKNLQLFRFTKDFDYTAETLATRLEADQFEPCGNQQLQSFGWVAPLGNDSELLTHGCQGRIMICAKKQERILPASVVREQVDVEAEQIEQAQGRRVFPSERKRIRDEVTQTLLPKAFTKSQLTFAYIDPKLKLLIVDTSSRKRAEELTILLRQSLGSLPVVPPMVNQAPSSVMSHWLINGDLPLGFSLSEQLELADQTEQPATIKCKGMDPQAQPLIEYLEQGMQVKKLAVIYDENTEFVLNDDLTISRLRLNDIVRESVEELDKDDIAGRFDANFSIMSSTINEFLPKLMASFGGENTDF
jgi:recombination associated protein RdgC